MKRVYQNTDNDSFAACIASLLEIEIESVPVYDNWKDYNKWLNKRQLSLVKIPAIYFDFNSKFHFIVTGRNPFEENLTHSVIYFQKKMIHDPNKDKIGLSKLLYNVFVIAAHEPSRFSFNYLEYANN